jgi:hypothetical protein
VEIHIACQQDREADDMLIRAQARANQWKPMLEEGKFRSPAEIAARGHRPKLHQPAAAVHSVGAERC